MQHYCNCIYTKGMWYKNGPLHQNIHILSYVCDVECVCLFRPKEMVMILAVGKMGQWANWTMHTRHCINAVFEVKGCSLIPRRHRHLLPVHHSYVFSKSCIVTSQETLILMLPLNSICFLQGQSYIGSCIDHKLNAQFFFIP